MVHAHECGAPARRWPAWLAGACLWLGLAAGAWAQTSLTLVPSSLPNAAVDVPYDQDLVAIGGVAPYAYTLTGSLPPGLALDGSTGEISGTPSTEGAYPFSITVTDDVSNTATVAYEIDVGPAPTIAPPTLPDATVGQAYLQYMSVANGGTGAYHFTVVSGSLPPGMTLDLGGTLSGTPTAAGYYAFKIHATTAPSFLPAPFPVGGITQDYMLDVDAAPLRVSPANLPSGRVGEAYAATVSARGGVAPYAFAVGDGALPPGLSLDAATGAISGTPTEDATFMFEIVATDANGATGNRTYTVDVLAPILALSPASLPDGTVGAAYDTLVNVTGAGTPPYTFEVVSGALPSGVALVQSAPDAVAIRGVPKVPGSNAFTLQATDSAGHVASNDYTLAIANAAIVLTPAALPDGQVGTAYAQAFGANGGTGPYTFALHAGALPAGLSLAGDGALSGTPTTAGPANFTVAATDAFGNVGYGDYAVTIASPTITLVPATLPDGQVGAAYAQSIEASGGTAPYTFGVAGGALPPGTGLAPGGALSGTPTTPGNYAFTVSATDVHGDAGTRAYTLAVAVVVPPPPTVSAHQATTPMGTPVQVDLATGAAGGPFTGADVLSVSPANAGTTAIAPAGEGAYLLTFTPAQAFVGTAVVSYTLSNATGPSDAGTVTIAVTPLPDPLADAEVSGLAQAQSAVAQVFAQTQVTNVVQRLDRLQEPRTQPWGFWVAGSLRRGDLDANGHAEGLTFETSGVTTGADRQFGDRFSFGVAGGLGQDRTLVGNRGSRSDSRAHAAVGYGSFHPPESPFFVNLLHGHQRLSFDLRRATAPASSAGTGTGDGLHALAASVRPLAGTDTDLLDSQRTGGQDFSSLGAGYRYKAKAWTFTSYGREDDVRTQLDPYTEPAGTPGALHYDAQSMRTRTSTLGFRADGKHEVRWGTLLPKLKIELQRDDDDQGVVAVRYASEPDGPVFRSEPRARDNSRVALELGATLVTRRFLTLRLEYHAMLGGLYRNDNAIVFSFEKEH